MANDAKSSGVWVAGTFLLGCGRHLKKITHPSQAWVTGNVSSWCKTKESAHQLPTKTPSGEDENPAKRNRTGLGSERNALHSWLGGEG